MIPEGVKYYGKGGQANKPCHQCAEEGRNGGCYKYTVCEFYARWVNASWKQFNRRYAQEMKKANCENCQHGDLTGHQYPCCECTRKNDEPPTEWTLKKED